MLAQENKLATSTVCSAIQIIYEGKGQPTIRRLGQGGLQPDLSYLYKELEQRASEFDVRFAVRHVTSELLDQMLRG
jgi:hypothetical protein